MSGGARPGRLMQCPVSAMLAEPWPVSGLRCPPVPLSAADTAAAGSTALAGVPLRPRFRADLCWRSKQQGRGQTAGAPAVGGAGSAPVGQHLPQRAAAQVLGVGMLRPGDGQPRP